MADPVSPKPNLLFLTQRLPYPPIKGEKIGSSLFGVGGNDFILAA